MKLAEEEHLVREAMLEANDTGRPAHLYLTDQRLVIEYDSVREAVTAVGEAALAGHSPLPLPLEWSLEDLAGAVSVRRLVGPPVLKVMNGRGKATLWKTDAAEELVPVILETRDERGRQRMSEPVG